jgi:hypothetical protein
MSKSPDWPSRISRVQATKGSLKQPSRRSITQRASTSAGKNDVRLFSNTIYTPQGDAIDVIRSSSQVEIRDNILWTGGGYDIYVANDSTSGFFSDYNDLHTTGPGKLIFWTQDFTDLLVWQQDVNQSDLHSIGRTAVNPNWSQPRFVGLALGDFRVFDETARQRFSSPTIDLGDPRTDQAQPVGYQNLLINPGFEFGLTGWTAAPSGATKSNGRSPWSGSTYFFAGPNPVTTLDQSMDLIAAGVSTAAIDSQNLSLVFGGRVRSANEAIPDSATLTLSFFDAGNELHLRHQHQRRRGRQQHCARPFHRHSRQRQHSRQSGLSELA